MKEFIDWTVFLGMHHRNQKTRTRCKYFFVNRMKEGKGILMSLENVGKCDDVIWGYVQSLQEVYYPFMDVLHSTAKITRLPYSMDHFEIAKGIETGYKINLLDRLSIAMATDGLLYTLNPFILNMGLSNVILPDVGKDVVFSGELELLYQRSLVLLTDW